MITKKVILKILKSLDDIKPSEQAIERAMNEIRQRLTNAGIINPPKINYKDSK